MLLLRRLGAGGNLGRASLDPSKLQSLVPLPIGSQPQDARSNAILYGCVWGYPIMVLRQGNQDEPSSLRVPYFQTKQTYVSNCNFLFWTRWRSVWQMVCQMFRVNVALWQYVSRSIRQVVSYKHGQHLCQVLSAHVWNMLNICQNTNACQSTSVHFTEYMALWDPVSMYRKDYIRIHARICHNIFENRAI